MSESSQSPEPKFWLHVPLQTMRGDRLRLPAGGRVLVLGYSGQLCERDLPAVDPHMSASAMVVRQWLLFGPISEPEGKALFNDLVARTPVLALRKQWPLRIPDGRLQKSAPEHKGMFNGPTPTLIPFEFVPFPAWGEVQAGTSSGGESLLELAACPIVVDERIRTAIDLAVAARHDILPRSIFLSYLTILDSLATRSDRPGHTCNWIDEKITEAKRFKDAGLLSSLEGLKQESHRSAVRGLVARAARISGEQAEAVESREKLATKLYDVRSGLSHSGAGTLPRKASTKLAT